MGDCSADLHVLRRRLGHYVVHLDDFQQDTHMAVAGVCGRSRSASLVPGMCSPFANLKQSYLNPYETDVMGNVLARFVHSVGWPCGSLSRYLVVALAGRS